MGGTLTFKIDETLRSIIEHTEQHPPAPYWDEDVGKHLLLVKDQGVYLLSGAIEAQPILPGYPNRVRVYAREADPTKLSFDEWWGPAAAICGGDDFTEALDLDFFVRSVAAGCTVFRVTMGEDDTIQLEGLK